MERMGLEWHANITEEKQISLAEKSSLSSRLPLATFTTAENARKFTRSRWIKMIEKMKSRKFLMALATGVLIILNDGLSLGLDTETILYVVGIVGGWILGESAVDAVRASNKKEITPGDTGPAE
jgi:hypothetical protein